ncbi:MAG: TonB-dependent receptor [Acidobacteria bacterium]|nr:TonB-dependent receptor [Acidobacteriota bacterium]
MLSLKVTDPSNALVPGAHAVLVDLRWGTERKADTNNAGAATFDSLPPSDYSLEIAKSGFDKLRVGRIPLAVRDRLSLHLELKLLSQGTSITVTDTLGGVTTDASHGISVDQDFVQNLPVNGRNAESLILMTPGITSAVGGRGGAGGGFNANGLRSNTNYFTLDGLSLNSQVGGAGGPMMGGGRGPGGGGLMMGGGASFGAGTSTEMISIDALQEMRVQTSSFAPEFGRTPGAQVSMTSRGGTNLFHGSLFYYYRNDRLNANDWFANSSGYPKGRMRQNRPGGTLGGPILKNKTFFFASYERLKLDTPSSVIASVPDLISRRSAAAALRPFLNAFPIPNGAALESGAAEFRAVVVNPLTSDSGSLRVDHALNAKTALFGRFSMSQSGSQARASETISPNMLTRRDSRSRTLTAGGTRAASATLLHDVRFNYSDSDSKGSSAMDAFGGAVPLADARVFPAGVSSAGGDYSLMVLGLGGYTIGGRSRNEQKQLNAVYSLTSSSPGHTIKTGLDFRRIMPTNHQAVYTQSATFNGLSGGDGTLMSGVATNAQVASHVEAVYPVYNNFSAYAQDTWRATERTTFTWGLRWDLNPAPGVRQGPRPFVPSGSGVSQKEPLYQTRWLDIAPRLGLAYQMDTTENREMMFRAGVGLFYDLGYGMTAGAFGGAPYSSIRTISAATFPLTLSYSAPPVMPPTPPYGQLTTAESGIKSPMVYQWNTTLERYFSRGQMLSLGYVGTKGRRLLRTETNPSYSDLYEILRTATNGAESDYHGVQVQFRRRLSASLQTQASYTWAHSIDSASNDAGFGGGFASLFGANERGSSDYDIRHNLNVSGSYRLLGPGKGILRAVAGQWYLDWVAIARSGLPFDIQGVSSVTSSTDNPRSTPRNFQRGLFAQVRPDYNGLPVWVTDSSSPGGRRLNKKAFTVPEGYGQGNLARNSLRGFGVFQTDLSLRRQIPLKERLRLNVSAQAFNVFNNPNFANPSPQEGANLSSPNFGVMTRMLNQSGFGGGGLNSLYRSGGARALELALRLQF